MPLSLAGERKSRGMSSAPDVGGASFTSFFLFLFLFFFLCLFARGESEFVSFAALFGSARLEVLYVPSRTREGGASVEVTDGGRWVSPEVAGSGEAGRSSLSREGEQVSR